MTDKYPWKNGDILRFDDWLLIYDGYCNNNAMIIEDDVIAYHALYNLDSDYFSLGEGIGIGSFRDSMKIKYATNHEKKILFNVLKERGLYWDESAKHVRYSATGFIPPSRIPHGWRHIND